MSSFLGGIGNLFMGIIEGLENIPIVGDVIEWFIGETDPASPTYSSSSSTIDNTIAEGVGVARCYGKCKIGGNKLRFNDSSDSDLRIIFSHCLGEVNGITEWIINDITWASLSGAHTKTEYKGTWAQTADARFASRASAYRGRAYTAATFIKSDKQITSNPRMNVIMEALLCAPLAGGAKAFTRNNAVILYDWYLNVEGYSAGDLDLNAFKSLEALCDAVPAGGSIARYRFDYNFDVNQAINDSKKLLWASFNGRVVMSQGKLKPVWDSGQMADGAGGLTAKTVSHAFTEDNIAKGSFTWKQPTKYNTVRIHYLDSTKKYKKTSVEVKNEHDINLNGEILYEETCNYITDSEIARRRAKFRFYKLEYPDYNCKLTAFSGAGDLEIYDLVTVTHSLAGWTTKQFLVIGKGEDMYGRMQFALAAYYSGIYDDAEASDQSSYESDLPNPYDAPGANTGVGLALVSPGTGFDYDAVKISFTPPVDSFYAYTEIHVSKDDATYYLAGTSSGTDYTIQGMGMFYEPGDTCYVKLRPVNEMGVFGTLSAESHIAITDSIRLGGFYAGANDLWGGNAAIGNAATTIVLGNLDGTSKIALGPSADALTLANVGTHKGFYADGGGNFRHGGPGAYGAFNATAGTYTFHGVTISSDVTIEVAGSTANTWTINSDLDDVNVELILGRITGGNATLQWNGTTLSLDKPIDFNSQYATSLQNIPDLAAKGAGYWFDGVDDNISLGTDTDLDLGIGDGTYIVSFKNTGNDGAENSFFQVYDAGTTDQQAFYIDLNGYLYGKLRESGTLKYAQSDVDIGNDNLNHVAAFTIDRDSATGLKLYLDGLECSYTHQDDPTAISGDIASSSTKYIGITWNGVNYQFEGNISRFLFFNLALTATEVKAFSSGAPVLYKYIGASQTELVTDGDVSSDSFSKDAGWTYDDPNNEYDANIAITHAIYQDVGIKLGKKYRVTFTVKNYSSGGVRSIVGAYDVGATRTANGTYTDEIEVINPSANSLLYILGAPGGFVGSVTDISCVQIGCVLQLEQPGITASKWYDSSGNDLDGTVSGAVAINLPDDLATFKHVNAALAVADAAIDLNSQNLTSVGTIGCGTVTTTGDYLLANGNYVGISAAERLGFYTAGYAAFIGCDVGFGIASPSALIHGIKTTEQLRLGYDAGGYISVTVIDGGSTTISTTTDNATGNLTFSPAGDILLNPTGNDVYPSNNYDINLGLINKKFLTLYAAELHVQNLVAADVLSSITGHAFIPKGSTELTSDLGSGAGDTTITVKHNNLSSGDTVILENNGNVEFMKVISAAGGAGPYTYSVTRDRDGSGRNLWYAGDGVVNTGAANDGFIELYAIDSLKGGAIAGPAITGSIRNSDTYNDWTEAWAIGNLKGLYGYGADIYGAAFGKYSAADYITIEPTNGIRFLDSSDVVQAQLTGSVWTLGQVAAAKSNIQITAGAVKLRTNTTSHLELLTTGAFWAGDTITTERIQWDVTNGLRLFDKDNNAYVKFPIAAAATISGWTIGATTLANSTNIILDASNKRISIKDATFGNDGIQLQYNAGSPQFYMGDGITEFFQYTTAGGVAISTAKANAITVKSGGDITLEAGGDLNLIGADSGYSKITWVNSAKDAGFKAYTNTGGTHFWLNAIGTGSHTISIGDTYTVLDLKGQVTVDISAYYDSNNYASMNPRGIDAGSYHQWTVNTSGTSRYLQFEHDGLFLSNTNVMDLGETGIRWKNGFFAGNVDIGGNIYINTAASGRISAMANADHCLHFDTSEIEVLDIAHANYHAMGGSAFNIRCLRETKKNIKEITDNQLLETLDEIDHTSVYSYQYKSVQELTQKQREGGVRGHKRGDRTLRGVMDLPDALKSDDGAGVSLGEYCDYLLLGVKGLKKQNDFFKSEIIRLEGLISNN